MWVSEPAAGVASPAGGRPHGACVRELPAADAARLPVKPSKSRGEGVVPWATLPSWWRRRHGRIGIGIALTALLLGTGVVGSFSPEGGVAVFAGGGLVVAMPSIVNSLRLSVTVHKALGPSLSKAENGQPDHLARPPYRRFGRSRPSQSQAACSSASIQWPMNGREPSPGAHAAGDRSPSRWSSTPTTGARLNPVTGLARRPVRAL